MLPQCTAINFFSLIIKVKYLFVGLISSFRTSIKSEDWIAEMQNLLSLWHKVFLTSPCASIVYCWHTSHLCIWNTKTVTSRGWYYCFTSSHAHDDNTVLYKWICAVHCLDVQLRFLPYREQWCYFVGAAKHHTWLYSSCIAGVRYSRCYSSHKEWDPSVSRYFFKLCFHIKLQVLTDKH